MTGDNNTVRMLDDAGTTPELRAMLEAAVADEPSAAASARMMAKLDALGAGSVAASTSAAGTSKWILFVLGSAVVISAGVFGLTQRASNNDTKAKPTHAVVETPAREPPPVSVEPLAPEQILTPDPEPALEPKAATVPQPATRPAPLVEPDPKPPPSEIAIIKRARAAVRDGKYRVALSLAKQHASLYADGVVAEEREAIAVEALAGLSRAVAARARLERFHSTYPTSSYRQRLRELVRSLPE